MNRLTLLFASLSGRKTYVAAGAAAVLAGIAWYRGDSGEAQKLVVLALGFAGLRHALEKRDPPSSAPAAQQRAA